MAASGRARGAPGFTLLEVLMVVALIAAFVTIVGARIGGGFGIAIAGESRVIASELRQASQRALATGRTQRWVVNLDAQTFRLEEQIEIYPVAANMRQALWDLMRPPAPTRHFVPVDNSYGGWRRLEDDSILFTGVETRDGLAEQGLVPIGFGPDGGADLALIELADTHENRLGVRVDAFTGVVRILDEEALDADNPLGAQPILDDDSPFEDDADEGDAFDDIGEDEERDEEDAEGEDDEFE